MPILSQDAVYAVTDAEYEELMELMPRRSLLHDITLAAPLKMLLHAVKMEPPSPPRSSPRNRDVQIGHRVVKEERLSPPPSRVGG